MKYFFAFLLILGTCHFAFSQVTGTPNQVIINKLWQTNFGNPSNIDWSVSTLDVSGNLLTTGNKVDSSGRILVYLIKQSPSGVTLWERVFSPQNNNSYGIGIDSDLSGNIYISAATRENSLQYDYLILKYDSLGNNTWSKVLNGAGNGDDIPTGITCSENRVYVTGLSEGVGTSYDYWTLGLSSINGTSIWSERYNFANFYDTPAFIKLDKLGFLIVTGVSASSPLNWELATIKYSQAGQLVSQNRVSNNGAGFFLPSWLDIDDIGNIYVTGTYAATPTNLYIKTVKINSNFTLGWQSLYDSPSSLDSSTVVKVDNLGNVIVSGYTKNADGSKNGIIIKHDSSGNIVWKRMRAAHTSTSEVIPRRMSTDNSGNIIVAYEVADSSKSMIDLVGYDQYGEINWVEAISLNKNSINRPGEIILTNGDILVSAFNKQITGNTYFTFRLNLFIRLNAISATSQDLVKNEIVVRFAKGVTQSSFINNPRKRSGKIHEAIDAGLINIISTKLQASNFSEWDIIKVFPEMTEADSVTNSYAGNQMRVPAFYNTFIIRIPRDYYRIIGESSIADTIFSQQMGCNIIAASPNYFLTPDNCEPNDPRYQSGEQSNLSPTTNIPNGNINMPEAWCIWEGSADTKVVIADFGILWSHEDFGDGTYDGSVIVGGKNYATGGMMPSDFLPGVHGTQVASIIGSIRNNGIGVAGIAGGTGIADGVRLVPHKISFTTLDHYLLSIKDAVDVDLANVYNVSGGMDNIYLTPALPMLEEVLSYANRKGLTVVASRGNNPAGTGNELRYPACAHDDLTISVSGSKEDGTKDQETRSSLVDVIAPSRNSMVTTALASTTSNHEYTTFAGTSASTPHVSAQAALMIGYYKDNGVNLSPDDIEFLIEKSATDVGTPGFDQSSGAGRIDVGNLMKMIERPKCNIFHFGINTNPYTRTVTGMPIDPPLELKLTVPFTDAFGQEFPITCKYDTRYQQLDYWIEHNLPPNYHISQIWPRNSNSTLCPLFTTTSVTPNLIKGELFPKGGLELVDFDENMAHFRGYIYTVWSEQPCHVIGYIPHNVTELEQVEYSVLACDISTETTNIGSTNNIIIYPNPVTDELNIDFPDNEQIFYFVKCFNSSGHLFYEREINSRNSNYSMSITDLPSGVYFISVYGENGIITQKFVKN